jgi:hypothetical protein
MFCKNCENSGVIDDLQGVEDTVSYSNSSPSDLFMELENLENTIARLKVKQCELKRIINRRHSSFIRTIPSEIIATISGFANTDFTITPVLLSSVCSDWRRAVVGTPELWSSIKIDLPDNDMAAWSIIKLRRLATFIDEWLARSGRLPLNISLCFNREILWDSSTLVEYLPIFKILNKYSSRWHSVNISIPAVLYQFLQPDYLPLLEQLHIICKPEFHGYFIFPPTPCLNTVEIHPSNYELRISLDIGFGIKWNTVTHVSLESITSCDCFALLRLNPQLVHCTFHGVLDDTEDPLESPILSSLTYLSLHHRRDTSRILDNIELPCLKTLVMHNVIIDPVIAFVKRSACSLHTLSLLNWQIRKTDKLIPLLQFLSPSLTRLAISRLPSPIRGTKNYLSLLTQIYTFQSEVVGNEFLPHLEIFEYREESPSTLESSMLSNLPSRNYPKPATSISLRSAYISMATVIDKEIPHAISVILLRLEEDGILTYT